MRHRLITVFLLLFAFVFRGQAGPPNIVFIMADDMGYGDLGCYGQRFIQTPNIDRLAGAGIRFTDAYAGSTVCAPSRGSLMTGLHNGHSPVRDNVPHYDTYLKDGNVTIAEVLKQAGYRCGGIGKWSLGDAGTEGRPTNQGFDGWLGYFNQDEAHFYYPDHLDDGEGKLELPDNAKTHEFYSHHLMTDWALDFIRESKEQPFFLYAAYTVPHFSNEAEDPTQFPVPSDAPYGDKPWTQAEKNYAAMITLLDRDVGRIVALVEQLGLGRNTLIVFASDNGAWKRAPKKFNSSGSLRGFKRDMHEGGIRVPFIAKWPGVIPAGVVSNEIIAFWDMLPTFAELAGTAAPGGIDGISVVEAFKGGSPRQSHDYLYWDYGHCRRFYDQAVRMGNWKAVRLGKEKAIQLYDLETDPAEANNVVAQHPEIAERMRTIMATAAVPHERYPIGKLYTGKPKH